MVFSPVWGGLRDGQVRAKVIQITSRVSGSIVKLAVQDNQFVKAGDLLFEVDPRTYQAALDQAAASLDETRDHAREQAVPTHELVTEKREDMTDNQQQQHDSQGTMRRGSPQVAQQASFICGAANDRPGSILERQ